MGKSVPEVSSTAFFKIQSDIRAQLSRQWLNRLVQANSTQVDIHVGHHAHSIHFHSILIINYQSTIEQTVAKQTLTFTLAIMRIQFIFIPS